MREVEDKILKTLTKSKKSLSIDDILNNEDKLYGYCEKYANAGITKIYEWYTNKNYDFETIISKMLLELWDKIDLKSLNQLE